MYPLFFLTWSQHQSVSWVGSARRRYLHLSPWPADPDPLNLCAGTAWASVRCRSNHIFSAVLRTQGCILIPEEPIGSRWESQSNLIPRSPWGTSDPIFQSFVGFFAFFFFAGGGTPPAYGHSQARGWIRATAAGLHQSHSHGGSKPHLSSMPWLMATLDPLPTEQGQGLNLSPHGY